MVGPAHRYVPKLSSDGINWQEFDTTMIAVDTVLKSAVFKVTVPKDTLWVSAQELITSDFYERWENEIAASKFLV